MSDRYKEAQKIYEKIGVNTEKVLDEMQNLEISMHCWQGDDLNGFDNEGPLSGGIQATGNYPGKAVNAPQLMQDLDQAFALIPGKKRLNLHASYAVFEEGEWVDRDRLKPKHFKAWLEYAKERDIGIDFNGTFFSHKYAEQFTLSSNDEEIRRFWVRHGQACIKIAEYFAEELGGRCLLNIWIPDGYKDIPADRLAPRERLTRSLDEILSIDYDKEKVQVSLESKVFGIGLESYTVCSSEYCINYAATRGILVLMDNGHYHPTELVSDKIPAMLCFYPEIALHVTRGVRWDSDHVLLLDDETREIAKEIVRCNALERVYIALDYFDASINRVSAWAVGMRSFQKSLMMALCTPNERLKKLQDESRFTELMIMQEAVKMLPFGDVWNYYCEQSGVAGDFDLFGEVQKYEAEVLRKR